MTLLKNGVLDRGSFPLIASCNRLGGGIGIRRGLKPPGPKGIKGSNPFSGT